MATDSSTAGSERTIGGRLARALRAEGTPFVLGAVTFFLESGVLTRSGQPGASTPVPWVASHALWIVATAFVAAGTLRTVRRLPAARTGIAGPAAGGLFGLGVLHTIQWTTWVYVDVIAYRQGAHDRLSPPLFHPFGAGHVLVFAIVLGSALVALAWALRGTDRVGRLIPRLGGAIGALTVLAGAVALSRPGPEAQ